MTLGDLVKEYREKHNISMDEFAKACNLSKGYISMLENNTNPRNNKPIAPTLPTIKKISTAMNMDVDSVLKILDSSQKIVLDYDTEKATDSGQIQNFTSSEIEHMKKYRFISEYSTDGTKVVDAVLDREYSIAGRLKSLDEEIKKLKSDNSLENVHSLNEPTEKVKELTEFSKYVNENVDYVNAAHPIEGASEEDKQFDEDIMDDEDF